MEEQTRTFINGREQIIEFFSLLTAGEKEKLIRRVKMRNPQLAEELLKQAVNFKMLLDLSDGEIKQVISHIEAPVLGISLRALPVFSQKKILSLCHRAYAEKAYHAMSAPINNEQDNIKRACERVKNVMASLIKQNRIKN